MVSWKEQMFKGAKLKGRWHPPRALQAYTDFMSWEGASGHSKLNVVRISEETQTTRWAWRTDVFSSYIARASLAARDLHGTSIHASYDVVSRRSQNSL